MAAVVIDADRPETVDRNVLDVELVDGLAVVVGGRDVQVEGVLFRIAAQAAADPIRRRTGSTFPLGPNMPLVSGALKPMRRASPDCLKPTANAISAVEVVRLFSILHLL
jgi:hypothetical protein